MSNSLNKVQLIGNLTADPEIKQTPSGVAVATFSIATNKSWKDAAGIKQEEVEFHNIVLWRGLADLAEQYLNKGKKVYIEWSLKTRTWDDAAWVKRYKTEIVGDNMIFLNNAQWGGYQPQDEDVPPPKENQKVQKKSDSGIELSDIPF